MTVIATTATRSSKGQLADSAKAPKARNEVRAAPAAFPEPPVKLLRDPIPKPPKKKRSTGKVRLVLDHGESTEVTGIVYGLEHRVVAPTYRMSVFLDSYNRRIKVLDYKAEDYGAMVLKLRFLAEANKFDKIWITANERDWGEFLKHGYVLEGILRYHNRGRDSYFVSKFRSQRRMHSKGLMKEILLVEEVLARQTRGGPKPLPPGYTLDFARERDVDGMLKLYRQVFKTYPSPLTYRDYLLSILQRDAIFRVIRREGVPVAAASAELDPKRHAAELTDCATHSDERGKGLIGIILNALENDLRHRRYRCAFTLARAQSYGMNAAFHSLGYEFNGRLVNNCDIYGAYEDMNIWVKDLRPHKRAKGKARPKCAAAKPKQ
ncbi:MAG TPA: putative beta-lysine N-acetyltransferase [Myxococcales bacterium]|jgi:putative beta-lysine N-acetyltransferase|nr:putative beta-lysine N-acetyltransferase [Myxococcales bacterium]